MFAVFSFAFVFTTTTAFAALTFNSTTVSSDGALTLTGASSSIWDLGASNTLSLQTTNNGAITTGSGLFTLGGSLVASIIRPSSDSTTAIQIRKADGTTNVLNVDTTNAWVGIGTTAPATKLSIAETSTGVADAILRFVGNGNNAVGTVLGAIEFYNGDGSGSSPNVPAAIKALSNNGSGAGGVLAFYTHPQGSVEGEAAIEAMRLNGDGAAGLWTTSANNGSARALEINSTTGNDLRLTYNDSDGGATNYTDFLVSSNGSLTITPAGTSPTITLSSPVIASSALNKGTVTLSSGTGTATVTSGATCVVSETTDATKTVKGAVSGTTLTITGTGSDVIAYICL